MLRRWFELSLSVLTVDRLHHRPSRCQDQRDSSDVRGTDKDRQPSGGIDRPAGHHHRLARQHQPGRVPDQRTVTLQPCRTLHSHWSQVTLTNFSLSLGLPDSHPRRREWPRTDAVSLPPACFSSYHITFTLSKCKRKPSIFNLSFPFTHPSYASWIYTSILFIYFMKMFLKSLCVQFLMSFSLRILSVDITIWKRQWRKWKNLKTHKYVFVISDFSYKNRKNKKESSNYKW